MLDLLLRRFVDLAGGSRRRPAIHESFSFLDPFSDEAWATLKDHASEKSKELTIYHSTEEFKIVIDRTTGGDLGVEWYPLDDSMVSLKVLAVIPGGLVQQCSENRPGHGEPPPAVKPGDHIVEVNSIRDNGFLLSEECSKDKILELVVQRGLDFAEGDLVSITDRSDPDNVKAESQVLSSIGCPPDCTPSMRMLPAHRWCIDGCTIHLKSPLKNNYPPGSTITKKRTSEWKLLKIGIGAVFERRRRDDEKRKRLIEQMIEEGEKMSNDDERAREANGIVRRTKIIQGGDASRDPGDIHDPAFFHSVPYIISVRFRFGFFLMSTFVLMISCFSGIVVETISGVFSHVFDESQSQCTVMIFLMPLYAILFALACDTVCVLVNDALTDPPFSQLQAAVVILVAVGNGWLNNWKETVASPMAWFSAILGLIAVLTMHWGLPLLTVHIVLFAVWTTVMIPVPMPSEQEHGWTIAVLITDGLMFALFEVVPLASGVRGVWLHRHSSDERGNLGAFWRSYLWGGIVAAVMATGAFRLCNLICAWSVKGAWALIGRGHRGTLRGAYMRLSKKIRYHRVPPGMLYKLYDVLYPTVDNEPLEEDRRKRALHGLNDFFAAAPLRTSAAWRRAAIAVVLWAFVMVVLLEKQVVLKELQMQHLWEYIWLPIALASVVGLLSSFLSTRAPRIFGASYYFALILMGVIISILIISGCWNCPEDFGALQAAAVTNGRRQWRGSSQGYALCEQHWGKLTAIDLAQLSMLAYKKDCDFERELSTVFPTRTPWVPEGGCTNYLQFPRTIVFDFPAPDGHNKGMRVISYKGTSTPKDALVDAVLWSSIKVLQFLSQLFPVLSFIAMDQVQWLIQQAHIPGQVEREERFWLNESRWLRNKTRGLQNDNVVLTGHSLGGGLAQVLAARVGLRAVVFSPPGIGYSALRFGVYKKDYWDHWMLDRSANMPSDTRPNEEFSVQHAKRLVTAIVPDFDQVPRVDDQLGHVQHIECRRKPDTGHNISRFGGWTACHSLRHTTCELWRVCGDEDSRNFSCDDYVQFDGRGAVQWYSPDDVS